MAATMTREVRMYSYSNLLYKDVTTFYLIYTKILFTSYYFFFDIGLDLRLLLIDADVSHSHFNFSIGSILFSLSIIKSTFIVYSISDLSIGLPAMILSKLRALL